MSGIRVSNVWAREDNYGEGHGANSWMAPPPGSYISINYNRSANTIFSPGSKTFDTAAYGAISGSWSWNFNLDYDYMEPLTLAFEGYSVVDNKDGTFTHTLAKANNKRIPSFTIRRKQLNIMAGGPANSDEMDEIVGCIVKNIKFNMQAGSSQIGVSMSGSFANIHTINGTLTTTDYQDYDGDLAEFSCMFIGDAKCNNYVANVDSLSIGIGNSSAAIYSTCSPVSKQYSEGKSEYTFSTSCYSNNPAVFKNRVFSGGYDNAHLKPRMKNLKPLPLITLATYNKAADEDMIQDESGQIRLCTPQEAIDTSTRSVKFSISKCILNAIEWQRGDDAKIMDQLSSVRCGCIWLEITNAVSNLSVSTAHQVESSAPSVL